MELPLPDGIHAGMNAGIDAGIDLGPLAVWASMFAAVDPAGRIATVEAALQGRRGPYWRGEIGKWIGRLVPVEFLVPDSAARWRPLVRDAFQFLFERLSDRRLATKVVQQFELSAGTAPEQRLLRLINQMPGLQKLGQVLARNRRLAPDLRRALSELENGMSDVSPEQVRRLIEERLGTRLAAYAVEVDGAMLSEATVSAVIRFTWHYPGREREQGVFKVLKPYVPECFGEDMTLLQELGEFLASPKRGYGFAIHDVKEMLAEVLLLLDHELDFRREQATLLEAAKMYRASIGIRIPRLIEPLCTNDITAMSAEAGVKVTEAFPNSPIRRARVAEQLIEALVAVPFFSRQEEAIFHADPHAGNLLYDETNRELVVLDWALAERLSLESRRQLILLSVMMTLRNRDGVGQAIRDLSLSADRRNGARLGVIEGCVNRFFDQMSPDASPGTLDAMRLLDRIALEGVRFPPSLFLFHKIVLTLDGVLYDVAGPGVRIDEVIAREFLTRCAASLGVFHAPLQWKDFAAIQWNALLYPARR
ncbi:MAG TPA: AarF/UbiB family protein [Candidatus Acidoferrales bacterium]|jgi:ubiquinone biosynthesis protein|nr:AarF/UbiB family protein [Candidatus Acidoferrales bacterium]